MAKSSFSAVNHAKSDRLLGYLIDNSPDILQIIGFQYIANKGQSCLWTRG